MMNDDVKARANVILGESQMAVQHAQALVESVESGDLSEAKDCAIELREAGVALENFSKRLLVILKDVQNKPAGLSQEDLDFLKVLSKAG